MEKNIPELINQIGVSYFANSATVKKFLDPGKVDVGGENGSVVSDKRNVWGIFPRCIQELRRYFAVSHRYVLCKLMYVMFPFMAMFLERKIRSKAAESLPSCVMNSKKSADSFESNRNVFFGTDGTKQNYEEVQLPTRGVTTDSVTHSNNSLNSPPIFPFPPSRRNLSPNEVNNFEKIIPQPKLMNFSIPYHEGGDFTSSTLYECDLYIPLMALITYVLLYGIIKGAFVNSFHPGLLVNCTTFSFGLLFIEVAVTKIIFYVQLDKSSSNAESIKVLDVVSYCSYKYVALVVIMIVGCLLSSGNVFLLEKPSGKTDHSLTNLLTGNTSRMVSTEVSAPADTSHGTVQDLHGMVPNGSSFKKSIFVRRNYRSLKYILIFIYYLTVCYFVVTVCYSLYHNIIIVRSKSTQTDAKFICIIYCGIQGLLVLLLLPKSTHFF